MLHWQSLGPSNQTLKKKLTTSNNIYLKTLHSWTCTLYTTSVPNEST